MRWNIRAILAFAFCTEGFRRYTPIDVSEENGRIESQRE